MTREEAMAKNMSDLIYKQSVVNKIDGWIQCCTENDEDAGIKSVLSLLKEHIESLPSADRPTGKWVSEDGTPSGASYSVYCSRCGQWSEYRGFFCSWCGAKMGGDTE